MPTDGGRILVVDDNRMNRMMLDRALVQQGYTVATAENGRQALEMLANDAFDVVLLDILMPEVDGYEALAQIKGDSALRHIPVIMISAVEEMDSVIRCIQMGATDYLPKPFNPALLRARLNTSLAEKRLRDLEREYLEQVGYVAGAAAAVESATFDPVSLDGVAAREDALGQLARVFQRMAREVHLREQRLKQQLQQLHLDIEDMRKALVEPISVYLPMDRRHALVRGETLPERTAGAALFADISGFTPLTAALAQELGRQRGAEELTRLLNQVYGALIAEVHRYGGSVIGFSGDAITCWLDGDDGRRAVACGLAMQEAMAPFSAVQTPGGSSVSLVVKIAAARGPVRRFLVGDPQLQVVEVIAGRTLDELARAEHHAQRGEVLVAADLVEASRGQIAIREWRCDGEAGAEPDAAEGTRFGVVSCLASPVAPLPWPELPPNCLPDELCRPWVQPAVYRRMCSDTRQFLAELRPAVALFMGFRGIDYDRDDQAAAKLDAMLRWAQRIVDRFEGSLVQVTIGDKGSYLYAAFGAPVAHSDDEVRAVQAALALQVPPPELQYITGVQIGLARGEMRTGAYGSTTQRTYGVLGDKTNLAARLMQAAADGILCDEAVYHGAQERLTFQPLAPLRVKGKLEPISVFRPGGEAVRGPQSVAAIQAIVDRLAPAEQLTFKVASVAGCEFSLRLLHDIYPSEPDREHLPTHLQTLERLGLIIPGSPEVVPVVGPDSSSWHGGGGLPLPLVPGGDKGAATVPESIYCFKSPLIQELAYNSMLFAQRRQLHRLAAEWYERVGGDGLAPHYAKLARHWRLAEEPARAVDYMEKAAQQALQAGAYEEAERLLQESLELNARSAVLSDGFYDQAPADYEGARRYALDRLERDLAPELTYHNLFHTRDDVLPAVQQLAAMLAVSEEETRLLETAAAWHDVGYTVQRQEHERMGAEIAGKVLPNFDFSPAQIAVIQSMILATQLPQSPRTPLEEILADADLDVLGRGDFLPRNQALRDELAASGTVLTPERWYGNQLQMLHNHHYFTAAARALRSEGKEANIKVIRNLLDQELQEAS